MPRLFRRLGQLMKRYQVDPSWSGTGTIVRKSQFEKFTGAAVVPVGKGMSLASGTVPARWVFVVADAGGHEHVCRVDETTWQKYEVGDAITVD